MTEVSPLRNIAVVGDGLRAALTALYLGQMCGRAGTKVVLVEAGEDTDDAEVVARPPTVRFLAEIGIDPAELCKRGIASPIFATEAESDDGVVTMPFAPSGSANGGVDFHQHWLRAKRSGLQATLNDFSLPLTLHASKRSLAFESAASFDVPFGLRLRRAALTSGLVGAARSGGVQAVEGKFASVDAANDTDWPLQISVVGSQVRTDFMVDVTSSGVAARALKQDRPGWQSNVLWIAGSNRLPGVELSRLHRALTRYISLIPNREHGGADAAEFNRIYHAEEERITDMEILLSGDREVMMARPALARKIDVFSACGRIPAEDYEVFQPCEWLAVLMARGYLPRRPERLAERMPETELHQWLGGLREQIAKLRKQMETA